MNVLSLCRVRETSPGTHTFFRTYTCPVYCWRSVQLLDFSLFSSLIHASQPFRISCPVGTTFKGQCFASGFLQTPPHDDALAFGCILPTAGRIRDFHPLERAPAGHTETHFATSCRKVSPVTYSKKNSCPVYPLCRSPSAGSGVSTAVSSFPSTSYKSNSSFILIFS